MPTYVYHRNEIFSLRSCNMPGIPQGLASLRPPTAKSTKSRAHLISQNWGSGPQPRSVCNFVPGGTSDSWNTYTTFSLGDRVVSKLLSHTCTACWNQWLPYNVTTHRETLDVPFLTGGKETMKKPVTLFKTHFWLRKLSDCFCAAVCSADFELWHLEHVIR